jgi:UDP-sugar pyrophosphorylase
MLRSTEAFKDGDTNDAATGFSVWPGNINELLFKLESYDAALEASKGAPLLTLAHALSHAGPSHTAPLPTAGNVPEFVNPKYADAAKTKFKSPTRLECMMQVPACFPSRGHPARHH